MKKKDKLPEPEDDLDYPWDEAIRFVRDLRAGMVSGNPAALDPVGLLRLAPEDYIGFVPTPMKVVHRMLQVAEIQAGETVYDLGCGDGRILISAARKYHARGVGIDIDPDRLESARERSKLFRDRITFREQSVFKTNLRSADVVTLYLLPSINAKLMPRLRMLKSGARIVTHNFELPGVAPYKVSRVECAKGSHNVFAYRTPLRSA